MHLPKGGRGQRLGIHIGEMHAPSALQTVIQDALDDVKGFGRHLVLQTGQFIGDVRRKNVDTRREELADLDPHTSHFGG